MARICVMEPPTFESSRTTRPDSDAPLRFSRGLSNSSQDDLFRGDTIENYQGYAYERNFAVGRHFANMLQDPIDQSPNSERIAYRQPSSQWQFDNFDSDTMTGLDRPFDNGDEADLLIGDTGSSRDSRGDSWSRVNQRFVIDPQQVEGVQEVSGMLGVGTFSEVYHCVMNLPNEQNAQVALKLFDQYITLADTEAELMTQLHHPNLVGLRAAIHGLPCGLALELCAGGTLQNFLHGANRQEHLERCSIQARLEAAQGLLSALEYLHGRNTVHRDVKPGNCFLTHQAENGLLPPLKLGDLGFARQVSGEQMTRWRGTIRYTAPEVFETVTYGLSADVYSFGILLHELLSGQKPYTDMVGANEGRLAIQVIGGRRPPLDLFSSLVASDEICSIIASCWGLPQNRPSASTLINQVEDVIRVV